MGSKKVESFCSAATGVNLELPQDVVKGISELGGFSAFMKELPDQGRLRSHAKSHHAMSDPIRMKILWALSKTDLCPCLLKRVTRISDSKLSYHLKILEKAALIKFRRDGNWRIYSITLAGSKALGSTSE